MNAYYIEYPRDFANEYTVYAVPSDLRERFTTRLPGARRLTRSEAIKLGISRPAQARREGEQWYGGLCDHDTYLDGSDDDRLAACAEATRKYLEFLDGNVVEREAAPEPVDFEALGKKFGETMREEYIDEFDEDPDRETIGDWDSAALEKIDRADKKLIDKARDPQVAWCEFQDGFSAAFFGE